MTITRPRSQRPLARLGALVAASVATLSLLAGCATTDSSEAETEAAQLVPTGEGTTEYPLTLETPFGKTVLEEQPQRVAVITASTIDTDALLALDVIPVMAPTTVERNVWLDDEDVAAIETLWESEAGADVSPEQVAASKPDLIVSLSAYETFDQAMFDKLSTVAPILYAPYGLTWQEITQAAGDALDLGATATEKITETETAIADLRAAHPEFEGKTVAQVMVYAENYGASYNTAPGWGTDEIFEQLGFVIPEEADQFIEDDLISDENIGLIDADFLMISTSADDVSYFLDSPLLQQVPAVADGRAVIDKADAETGINHLGWGLNVPSALSLPWALGQISEMASGVLTK